MISYVQQPTFYLSNNRRILFRFPHLLWVHCTAHALDLALEDMGKLPAIKRSCDNVREIIRFTKNHQMSRALFNAQSTKKLLSPGK